MPDTDKKGIILSYTVNYKATPEGNPQLNQIVNASTREVTLTGLVKNTEYKIAVFANTSKGGGMKSEPFTVQTDEDSKYTIILQWLLSGYCCSFTDALCRFAILPKFILLWREKKFIY